MCSSNFPRLSSCRSKLYVLRRAESLKGHLTRCFSQAGDDLSRAMGTVVETARVLSLVVLQGLLAKSL